MDTNSSFDRVILVVLDSVGVGAAQDAARFKDQDANTLKHIGDFCKESGQSFALPNLSRWGLGLISPQTYGLKMPPRAKASTARLRELSPGKDTTTGHWELAGTVLKNEFPVFENGFTNELLNEWCRQCGLNGWLGNKAASGTTILDELGEEHVLSKKPIVYTSGDSVFQIAAHETHFGLERLYDISKVARQLVDSLGVGRVIARPFLGDKVGQFKRTENRRDFSVPPPSPNVLDVLVQSKCFVAGIGKIEDIFAHRSITLSDHTGRNETTCEATLKMMAQTLGQRGLIFSNLIDFDQLHGHRRNPSTYAEALVAFDQFLPRLEAAATPQDLVVLTADHGNDPTHFGTDHTREDVPLLFWSPRPGFRAKDFGSLRGFTTVGRLILDALGMNPASVTDTTQAASLASSWT